MGGILGDKATVKTYEYIEKKTHEKREKEQREKEESDRQQARDRELEELK